MSRPSWNNEHGGHYSCTESGEGCIKYPVEKQSDYVLVPSPEFIAMLSDPRVRFKAVVRRRDPAQDDDWLPEDDRWPEELRWVADWNRHECATGAFVSGCATPFATFEEALAEAVAEADHVRAANARALGREPERGADHTNGSEA